ncbi:DEAD/DEAH box helicase [Haloarculaceae archaeon H-GB11]|nr:DEAD/DEAH box helicase [Haloarculaceae archaeon H-GB11]
MIEPENEALFDELRATTLRRIDEICKRQINAGEYDSTAKLSDIFEWFSGEYLGEDTDLVQNVLRAETVQRYDVEYGTEALGRVLFDRLIESLEDDDELLYVYDRQRVRSRVAEMARYFALIRQRIDEDTDFQFAPNLVKMVKLAIIDREQPIVDGPEAASFGETLRDINRRISGDVSPTRELEQTMGGDWKLAVKQTASDFKNFLDHGLNFDTLAAYQKRALVDIYTQAVTDQEGTDELAHVITASTGGGKTEAFLFPVLMYCHTAWKAGIEGNKAILTYPRRDLCDNQFERLFEYAYTINEQLGYPHASFEAAPISVSLQHGNRRKIDFGCPECDGTLHPPERSGGSGYRDGVLSCSRNRSHRYEWATTKRNESADIIVMTQNSLHLRMMDGHGRTAFWEQEHPPKFLVLDEVHVYTEQAGMHVSNVARRFKRAVREQSPGQAPSLVASSATINKAEDFTRRIFGTDDAKEITPRDGEKDTVGSEYIMFVKATEPRDVAVPIGDSVFKPQDEWDDIERTTASNLSCMIQVAFGFWHTARKERGGTRGKSDKDKILGFVDSIDSVSRLGGSSRTPNRSVSSSNSDGPTRFSGENVGTRIARQRSSGKELTTNSTKQPSVSHSHLISTLTNVRSTRRVSAGGRCGRTSSYDRCRWPSRRAGAASGRMIPQTQVTSGIN